MHALSGWLGMALVLFVASCGDLGRDNPFDPAGQGGNVDPLQWVVGSWSRVDGETNEVYVFKENRSVLLYEYFPGPAAESADPAQLDRNASYPQTVVVIYAGTYTLVDHVLSLSFTQVTTTDPEAGPPALPSRPRVASVIVDEQRLVLRGQDGDRVYTRFD